MKTKTRICEKNLSVRFFNLRLFLEGLKRLRVVGVASAILAVSVSALIPVCYWITSAERQYTLFMESSEVVIPTACMTLLAPIFFFALFSFLQKRKESDFFHAIPYTRTCVYVSFTAAALVFVWAIQLVSSLTAAILWSCVPDMVFEMGGLIAFTLLSMLAAAMLSAFMMLSLTVTGTAGSCIMLFFLFATFTRTVLGIFLGSLAIIRILPTEVLGTSSFLSPYWLLPLNLLSNVFQASEGEALLYSLPNLLYSIVVTLALFVLAGWLYNRRRSEMAGNPAPGHRTQAVFRILITMVPALLIPLFMIIEGGEPSLILVLVVITLLVYFLYELITTKRVRNMLKAAPSLAFVAAGCILFTLVFTGYKSMVIREDIEADEIRSVSVEGTNLTTSHFRSVLLDHYRTDDGEILSLIADRLAYSQAHWRNYAQSGERRVRVTIYMKDGRKLYRYINVTDKQYKDLQKSYQKLESIKTEIYRLPTEKETSNRYIVVTINGVSPRYLVLTDHAYEEELMEIFREEYEALSTAERENLGQSRKAGNLVTLRIDGKVHGEPYSDFYYISEKLPRTWNYFMTVYMADRANYYTSAYQAITGTADEVLDAFVRDCEIPDFKTDNQYVSLRVEIVSAKVGAGWVAYSDTYKRLGRSKLDTLVSFLEERNLMRDVQDPMKALSLGEEDYYIRLTVNGENTYEVNRVYISIDTLVHLTGEDMEALYTLLGIS